MLHRRALLHLATLAAAAARGNPARAEEDAVPRPLSAIMKTDPPTPSPALAAGDLDGHAQGLAALAGRPALVNFWATWCIPCVRELPELDALAAAHPEIAVVALSVDRGGAPAVRGFLGRHALPHLTIWLANGMDTAAAWGVVSFPTTVILDGRGRMRGRLEGAAAWSGAAETIRALTG